ncbi:Potassium voltage-gated channel protein egl-36 [Exaiptasia diaphana]|nr:Potassium voltage-gated channel protein egl-36 [Exaiptasia diaphana]
MSGMQVIGHTLRASARELFLLILILSIPMVIFSTLLYYAERARFKDRSDFQSIPETFWWAVITMTTVGYGDVYPKSPYGKMIGTVCACVGVLIVALPVSVIGSNFTLFYSHAQAQLKLPKKKKKPLLLGAAGALVSDTSLPDIDDDEDDEDDDDNEGEARLRGPRYSMSEFKHMRNPSIHPRSRTTRRQAQGTIDIPAMKSLASKAESENSDGENQPSNKTPLLSRIVTSDTSNMSNISNGLKGISDVMLQITAPVSRRMAISPIDTPPARRASRRRKRCKKMSNGNEESSGYERESFYTTDAESATENTQARIEELREQMRAQKNQSTSSNSSNYYPHSSKENITSGDEHIKSPLSHEQCKKSPPTSEKNEELSPSETKEGPESNPCRETDLTENLERVTSPIKSEGKSDERARTPELPPPNIWDRPPDIDTWVKQPTACSRFNYSPRKSPNLSRENLRNDNHHKKDNIVTFDDTPKPAAYNGSANDLRVPSINSRKPCASSCTHTGILKDRSHSKSLDKLRIRSPDECHRRNDEVILISGDAPEVERTHSRSNTIV